MNLIKHFQQTDRKFSALKKGNNGNAVKVMQTYLIKLDLSEDVADGKFVAATEAALIRFQRDNNLEVDGVAGINTLSKLYMK